MDPHTGEVKLGNMKTDLEDSKEDSEIGEISSSSEEECAGSKLFKKY